MSQINSILLTTLSVLSGHYILSHLYNSLFWHRGSPKLTFASSSTFLISGASQGIGRALVQKLVQMRAKHVVCLARGADKLEELKRDMMALQKKQGSASTPLTQIHTFALDCSDYKQVDKLRDDLLAQDLLPNVICNVAGAGSFRYLWEEDGEHVEFCLRAPYLAAAQISRAFLPEMIRVSSGAGRSSTEHKRPWIIANVQSPAAYTRFPGCTSYIATRYALRGLSEALRADLQETPIRVQEVIFTEVESEYFKNNQGSYERLPWLGLLLCGRLSVDDAATGMVRALSAQKSRSYAYGYKLRLFLDMSWLSGLFGECLHWLMTLTGWSFAKSRAERAQQAKKSQ